MTSRSDRSIVRARLAAQGISVPSSATPADIVRRAMAMQGQDLASVTWSIGLRNPALSVRDVEHAFLEGSIVRSWPMRGTLHVVAPEDLRWMLGLTRDRLVRGSLARRAALGLREADLETARGAARDALTGGTALSRKDIYRCFDAAGVSTEGQRGYHTLWYLAQTGTLCIGPPSGREQTFALLDEWVTSNRDLEGDEALGELAVRYFRGHGPASIRDFAWWSSLTLTDARRGLARARDELDSRDRDGELLYFAHGQVGDGPRDGIRLLPGFDEYILGYQSRTPQLSTSDAGEIVPGGNGVFRGTIVEDGIVVGTWKRAASRGSAVVESRTFSAPSSRLRDGIARETARYASFFDRTRNSVP
ncbi:MAG: AlkZ family DNA glycosylase [Cryobacterium sp.]|nr:AlkZ family DNA glycosylase [Cryobacterium sp.]